MTTSIIFMGTPEFAVPSLRALHEASARHSWQITAVVTQPDRPAGRSRRPRPSLVKAYAAAHDLPVLQPETLRKQGNPVNPTVARLCELTPDVIVVAAYGLILPKSVLNIPSRGCLNVHASLLPACRGASPINAAILNGLTETGNTIMLMNVGMDTGPALAQAALPIHPDETTPTLAERLAVQGASLLVETLPRWLDGEVEPVDQADLPGEPSAVSLIKKEDGRIDWSLPAARIERMTRAYTPWPSAFTTWNEGTFKIWRADAVEGEPGDMAEPGRVVETGEGPAVGTGDGLLLLRTVQPAGKRQMEAASFLNGAPEFVGSKLG